MGSLNGLLWWLSHSPPCKYHTCKYGLSVLFDKQSDSSLSPTSSALSLSWKPHKPSALIYKWPTEVFLLHTNTRVRSRLPFSWQYLLDASTMHRMVCIAQYASYASRSDRYDQFRFQTRFSPFATVLVSPFSIRLSWSGRTTCRMRVTFTINVTRV